MNTLVWGMVKLLWHYDFRRNDIATGKEEVLDFYFFPLPQKVTKRFRPRKFDYPLLNNAIISKLATLKHLKLLRLFINVGPSLHFLMDIRFSLRDKKYHKNTMLAYLYRHCLQCSKIKFEGCEHLGII